MKTIKCTTAADSSTVELNIALLVAVEDYKSGAIVYMCDGSEFEVLEKREDIIHAAKMAL